jgi:hypothetical protein
MTTKTERLAPRLPAKLDQVLKARFGGNPQATSLCAEFLDYEAYDRRLVTTLLAVSNGSAGDSWEIRLFATLMLANQCRRLEPGHEVEFNFLFQKLGILSTNGKGISHRVLREGYTSTDFHTFVAQFLESLRRLERVHRKIQGWRTTPRALEEFIWVAQEPCKLSLARYLFTPSEVADYILHQSNVSSGVISPLAEEGEREAEHYLAILPDYEKGIFRRLSASSQVYWVSERTPSEINSMIERPIGTVACAVKPPGSPMEFEIKRTGLRATFPLTASFTYGTGEPLPPSHRLQGGASTASLRWESRQAAVVSHIYRSVHGREAPVSKLLSLATYRTVPLNNEDIHLLDYFTDPDIFGDGYEQMREHMARCVANFDLQYGDELADLPGEVGLTGRFLAHVLPCQGILAQTSSYRLDTLTSYLSATGPDAYFIRGLKRKSYTRQQAKQFADSLLDEVLGLYIAPNIAYEDHARYLRAAFAIPANRIRADRFHAAAIGDLGMLWGTILALGAYSFGESFVARNLGLKSFFEGGEWTVKLFAMDHDNLRIPDEEEESFWPHPAYRASVVDESFLCANPGRPKQIEGSSVWCLEEIYHVDVATRARSKDYLHRAMEEGYRQARRGMDHDPSVQRFFSESYIRHLHDWDVIVADYLTICGDPSKVIEWKARTEGYLRSRNYRQEIIDNYLKGVEKHDDVVQRYSFLYEDINGSRTSLSGSNRRTGE